MKGMTVRSGADRVFIGIDLSDDFSQISYCTVDEPRTMSMGSGETRMCIPTMLAKRYGEAAWSFGEEAYEQSAADEAFPVDRLVERARNGAAVEVEAVDYDPTDLLALFMKKCLGRLSAITPIEKVAAIMISVEDPDEQMIKILDQVVRTLRLKAERVFYQSHAESAFNYLMHQSMDVRAQDVCVCDMRQQGLVVTLYSQNVHTKPQVMIMQERVYDHFLPESFEGIKNPEGRKKMKDQEFLHILQANIDDSIVSSVFLLGDGFEGDWSRESLKYICNGRRAFRGNNLYSKGACYGARGKVNPSPADREMVFLGPDKVKANIGMNVYRKGRESYMALLDGGKNWYDLSRKCELLLESERRIQFIITPLNGKEVRTVSMFLKGIPERKRRSTRVLLELRMLSESRIQAVVTDMGFGEFFEPSGMQWEMEFKTD